MLAPRERTVLRRLPSSPTRGERLQAQTAHGARAGGNWSPVLLVMLLPHGKGPVLGGHRTRSASCCSEHPRGTRPLRLCGPVVSHVKTHSASHLLPSDPVL